MKIQVKRSYDDNREIVIDAENVHIEENLLKYFRDPKTGKCGYQTDIPLLAQVEDVFIEQLEHLGNIKRDFTEVIQLAFEHLQEDKIESLLRQLNDDYFNLGYACGKS